VLLSSVLLPAWIAHRKSRSADPAEPVHHLHRYVLFATVPCAVFSVVRIPAYAWLEMPYWHPWYEFGARLTGAPDNQYASLGPGALLYTLQGSSLGLGYYVLFKRHSLLNAVLFLGGFLSSIYSFVFPVYGRVGMPSPWSWHAVAWGAHVFMALSAWYTPRFFQTCWPRLDRVTRGFVAVALAALLVTPSAFAFWKATAWQFPAQHRIDQAAFGRLELVYAQGSAALDISASEERMTYRLRLGPRVFTSYIKRALALDARNVEIRGRVMEAERTLAWCAAHASELPSARASIGQAEAYASSLERLNFTEIQIECVGPVEALERVSEATPVLLLWDARVTLVGDREAQEQRRRGHAWARVRPGKLVLSEVSSDRM